MGGWKRSSNSEADGQESEHEEMVVAQCRSFLIRATLALVCRVMEMAEYLVKATKPKREGKDDKVEQGRGL